MVDPDPEPKPQTPEGADLAGFVDHDMREGDAALPVSSHVAVLALLQQPSCTAGGHHNSQLSQLSGRGEAEASQALVQPAQACISHILLHLLSTSGLISHDETMRGFAGVQWNRGPYESSIARCCGAAEI